MDKILNLKHEVLIESNYSSLLGPLCLWQYFNGVLRDDEDAQVDSISDGCLRKSAS